MRILLILLIPLPLYAQIDAPDWLHFRPGIQHKQGCMVCAKRAPAKIADADGDGMADEFETKHGFDPKQRSDASEDADQDSFTNYEEYRSRTNPRDATSHPAFWTKLRVTGVTTEPVSLRLLGLNSEGPPVLLRVNRKMHAGGPGDWVQGVGIIEQQTDAVVCRVNGKNVTVPKGRTLELKQTVLELAFGDKTLRVYPSGDPLDLNGEQYRTHQLSRDGLLIREAAQSANISLLVPARSSDALGKINDLLK